MKFATPTNDIGGNLCAHPVREDEAWGHDHWTWDGRPAEFGWHVIWKEGVLTLTPHERYGTDSRYRHEKAIRLVVSADELPSISSPQDAAQRFQEAPVCA